jgi:hypothetical protein
LCFVTALSEDVLVKEALLGKSAEKAEHVAVNRGRIGNVGLCNAKQRVTQTCQEKLKRRTANDRRFQRTAQKNVFCNFRNIASAKQVPIFDGQAKSVIHHSLYAFDDGSILHQKLFYALAA